MNRLYTVLAAGSIVAFAAAAQDDHNVIFERMAPQVKVMGVGGGVMSKPVKGAPYAGVEVNENTQMLADGTRIHNESQTQVYRDSEGRMRRETPNEITIWDPVANASYVLNPKAQTARKLPMGTFVYSTTRNGNAETMTYTMRVGPVGDDAEKLAKLKAEMESRVRVNDAPSEAERAAKIKVELEQYSRVGKATAGGAFITTSDTKGMKIADKWTTEQLGKRSIEGVMSEGSKSVSTLEAGAIGNDRAIQSVTEKWYSPDLQVTMLLRRTDPRNGEEISKLVNVNRSEPAAYLFQVPAGYQIVEAK